MNSLGERLLNRSHTVKTDSVQKEANHQQQTVNKAETVERQSRMPGNTELF